MAWLRIDDGFAEHRKLLGLKRKDRWNWLELLCYCARQSDGGNVPVGVSDVLRYITPAFLDECANIGLLDRVDGGYVVHDWLDYNPKDPTGAARQQRYRNKAVTETVTDEIVTRVTPRARAARPVPSPTTKNTIHSTSTTDDDIPRLSEIARMNEGEAA